MTTFLFAPPAIDLDASVATGTAHRFEKVTINHVDERTIPNIQLSAAAAIAVGDENGEEPGRDRREERSDAHNISITSMLNLDSDADADALSITAFVPTAVGMALGGNYSQASNIAEIGDGANVSANSISIVAGGDGDVPFDYSATAATLAAGLGGNVAGSVAVNAMMNHTAVRIGEDAFVVSDTPIDLLANLRRSGTTFVDAGTVHSDTFAGEIALWR